MGSKRIGLARFEALLEAVDRDLNLANSTLTNCTITTSQLATFSGGILNSNVVEQSGTGAEDLTSTASNLVWYSNAAQAGAITLPQATAANAGMVIKIIVGTTDWSGTAFKLGFASGGSTVMCGQVILNAHDGAAQETAGFVITAGAKNLVIDDDAVATAGGAIGSLYEFTYLEANLVHVMAFGMINAGAPAPTAAASVTGGI